MDSGKPTTGVLNQKKKFPTVEIVMWIVVIAVILAILIPVYINLNNKVKEAEKTAAVNAYAEQMLVNMLGANDGKSDIILLRNQSDGVYVFVYDMSEKKIVEYKYDNSSANTFEAQASDIMSALVSDGTISKVSVNGDSWRYGENVKSVLEELDISSLDIIVYADYVLNEAK